MADRSPTAWQYLAQEQPIAAGGTAPSGLLCPPDDSQDPFGPDLAARVRARSDQISRGADSPAATTNPPMAMITVPPANTTA